MSYDERAFLQLKKKIILLNNYLFDSWYVLGTHVISQARVS